MKALFLILITLSLFSCAELKELGQASNTNVLSHDHEVEKVKNRGRFLTERMIENNHYIVMREDHLVKKYVLKKPDQKDKVDISHTKVQLLYSFDANTKTCFKHSYDNLTTISCSKLSRDKDIGPYIKL